MAFLVPCLRLATWADDYDAEGNGGAEGPPEARDHAVHRRVATRLGCELSAQSQGGGDSIPHPTRGTGTWGRYCSSFQVGEEEVLGRGGGRQAWVLWARLCLGCSWGAGLGKLGTGSFLVPLGISFWSWAQTSPPPSPLATCCFCATQYLSLPSASHLLPRFWALTAFNLLSAPL